MKKNFLYALFKTFYPSYYQDLSDKKIRNAIRYFTIMLLFSFIVMGILSLPKLYFLKGDFDTQVLDISKLNIDIDFETVNPIGIPRSDSAIVLDTTSSDLGEETILISNDMIYYRIFGEEYKKEMQGFDFNSDREQSKKSFIWLVLLFLPSLLFYYYLAYLLKYIILIVPLSVLAYLFAKLRKNKLSYRQVLVLGLYTATPMVLIEVLTLPFFISKYLLSISPVFGIHFSIVAITVFITLYVTSLRLSGNPDLKEFE